MRPALHHRLQHHVRPGGLPHPLHPHPPHPHPHPYHPLPVLVYFCGGGFQQCYPQDADPWVGRTQSFVFVQVAYRLGVFGFMAIRELSDEVGEGKVGGVSYSGNQGLQDQRVALQWLQLNVAAFGGDPSRVTSRGRVRAASACATSC